MPPLRYAYIDEATEDAFLKYQHDFIENTSLKAEDFDWIQLENTDDSKLALVCNECTATLDRTAHLCRQPSPAPRYTGTIAAITSRTDFNGEVNEQTMHYIYDRKDQLISAFNGVDNTYSTDDLTYDANGNLLNLKRYGKSGVLHDFTGDAENDGYLYTPGTNKLKRVFGMNAAETEEVEYARYEYDEIGQMTELYRDRDGEPEQWGFDYDVTGKVRSITDQSTGMDQLVYSYAYDDRGFRIRKTDHVYSNPQSVYVRDASGSIMAMYTEDGSGNYIPIEHPVYGSSRLGTYYDGNGQTHYELKDHLGNVRATVVGNATFNRTFEDEVGMTWGDDPNSEFTTAQAHSGATSWSIRDDQDFLSFAVSAGDQIDAEVWCFKTSGSSPSFKVSLDAGGFTQLGSVVPTSTGSWEKLSLSGISVTEDGTLYVMFEEGNNVSAYFDDLVVVHRAGDLVAQQTDYYPFGLVMQRYGDAYRFGYQGDFAEEDPETGFNHFEARQYDPVIGRWMIPDPDRQFFSPYMSMSNNPVNSIDRDGEWVGPVLRFFKWTGRTFGKPFLAGASKEYGKQVIANAIKMHIEGVDIRDNIEDVFEPDYPDLFTAGFNEVIGKQTNSVTSELLVDFVSNLLEASFDNNESLFIGKTKNEVAAELLFKTLSSVLKVGSEELDKEFGLGSGKIIFDVLSQMLEMQSEVLEVLDGNENKSSFEPRKFWLE